MIIWGALFIPFIAAIIGFSLNRRKITFWEFFIPFFVAVLLIIGLKSGVEAVQTRDTEYWGGFITHAHYDEDWNERVSCRHEIPCSHEESYSCGTSDSPRTCTRKAHSNDGYEHPYDVDYHPASWYFEDSLNQITNIDKGYYDFLKNRFNNEKFIELNRRFHDNDGDRYTTSWLGTRETIRPVTSMRSYTNRVQASKSIFKFKVINPKDVKDYRLHSYPKVYDDGQTQSVLGPVPQKQQAEDAIQYVNSIYGSQCQVRVFILIFQNQPLTSAFMQESYWMGGNKNEFVICIGTDKEHKVQWSHVFSWTEVESLKVEARNKVMLQRGKPLEITTIGGWLENNLPKRFERKQFKDFNYLTVEPPIWTVIIAYLLVALSSAGIMFWCVTNEFDADGSITTKYRR